MRRTILWLLVVVLSAACHESRPPLIATPAVTVSAIVPQANWALYSVQIIGHGFQPGARVTVGGIATEARLFNNERLSLIAPWHPPGTVDVIVTNPDGSSVKVARGFTYKEATLELSQPAVNAGGPVTVTWNGPDDSDNPPDVIELYAIDDPLERAIWSVAAGFGQGSRQFAAPHASGTYEIRYLMLSQYLVARTTLTVR